MSGNTSELSIEFKCSEVVFDPFEKKHKLFLLCGKGKNTLTDLHKQLYEGPHRAELESEIPYQPHMTIATHDNRSIIERLDVADIGAFPITGTIRALELVELVQGKLNSLETIPLMK